MRFFQNKSSRYANVNIHHHEFSQSSRNLSENEFDDLTSNKNNWATSSITGPGSLSDKYRSGEQLIEDTESNSNMEVDETAKKDAKTHPKKKPVKPLSDDGIITTVSQIEAPSIDDKCSSVISLSDKYRTQEEIEIFQVYKIMS